MTDTFNPVYEAHKLTIDLHDMVGLTPDKFQDWKDEMEEYLNDIYEEFNSDSEDEEGEQK